MWYADCAARALNPRSAMETSHVHPDRSHAQPGDPEDAAKSPLAERLFGIKGINGVFFGSDFITVSKAEGEWPQLKPAILGAIMEHFMSGAPLINEGQADAAEDEFFEQADAEVVTTIKDLIE